MTYRPRRRDVLSGVGIAGLGGLAGCLDGLPGLGTRQADLDEDRDEPIKLGVMQPVSGDLGSVGKPIRDSALLPVTQLESEGAPFEFDVREEDTETSPAAGVQAAARLVDDGYPAVNGPAASGVTLQATKQVLIPYRTVSCSPSSTSPTITALNDVGLVFRTAVSDSLQAVVLADRAADDLGSSSAATLYVNNDYGYQLSRAFTRAFGTDHGGTVTAQVPFDEGQDSYASELETAREDDPDLLIVIGYPESGAQLFTDFYETGGEEDVLVTDGLRDGDLPEQVGHSLDGIRGTAPLTDGPGQEFFSELYQDTYDREPGIFTAQAYDATAILLLANAYAGRNEGPAIRNAMQRVANPGGDVIEPDQLADGMERAAAGEDIEYQGASSAVRFDENGDLVGATFEYWEFDESANGGISEIDRVSA